MAGRFFVVPCTPQNDKEDEMTPKKERSGDDGFGNIDCFGIYLVLKSELKHYFSPIHEKMKFLVDFPGKFAL